MAHSTVGSFCFHRSQLLLTAVVFLCGCGGLAHKKAETQVSDSSTKVPATNSASSSSNPSVDWYFDGTRSMEGFVKDGQDTAYVYFTRAIAEGLDTVLPGHSLRLHRFGTESQTFEELKEAWRPKFYSSPEAKGIFGNTDLTAAVDSPDSPNHVTVIVSDLYPDESNFEPFRRKLIDKHLGKSFQFAVLACNPYFDGMIYDIPPDFKESHPFQGFRPVYALLLGSKENITLLKGEVRKKENIGTQVHAAVFSNDLGRELNVEESKCQGLDSCKGNGKLKKSNFVAPYRLSRSSKEPYLSLRATVFFDPDEVVPVDQWQLKREVRMCASPSPLDRLLQTFRNPKAAGPETSDGAEECPVAAGENEIVYPPEKDPDVLYEKADISVPIELSFGKRGDRKREVRARHGALYIINAKLVSTSNSVRLPDWVSDFSQDRHDKFNGSKTTDLSPFLQSIAKSILTSGNAVAMEMDVHIDSK